MRHGYLYKAGYDQNVGVFGCVYILENSTRHPGIYKIGSSSDSGDKRAAELTQKLCDGQSSYACVFERQTQDSGTVERAVFRRIDKYHRQEWGNEFFQIDLEFAVKIINEECERRDAEVFEVGVKRVGKVRARKPAWWEHLMPTPEQEKALGEMVDKFLAQRKKKLP